MGLVKTGFEAVRRHHLSFVQIKAMTRGMSSPKARETSVIAQSALARLGVAAVALLGLWLAVAWAVVIP